MAAFGEGRKVAGLGSVGETDGDGTPVEGEPDVLLGDGTAGLGEKVGDGLLVSASRPHPEPRSDTIRSPATHLIRTSAYL